ncbi:MAG: 2-methylcitrate dehydratase [Pseudomonadota bacterium]
MTPSEMYAITGQFIARFVETPLPDAVTERARLIALDTVAVIVRGYREADISAYTKACPTRPHGASLIRAGGGRTEPGQAILCNTASAAALELCEGHRRAMGHIALQILPAVLATAEVHHLPGRRILPALTLGYEIATRMGAASKRHFRAHGHGIWAAAGSAVAIARLLERTPDEIVECLKIASNLSLAPSFSTHAEGATVRNLTAGMGAMIGYQVPALQQAGYLGSLSAMSVTLGETLGASFSPERFVEGMGDEFCVMDNYFKFDASGRHMQAPAQALREIMAQQLVDPEKVKRIRVETYQPAATLTQREPPNGLAAKTSIPYAIAAQLILGHLGVEAYDAERLRDPRIQRLMQRVELWEGQPDPPASGRADPMARWARVIVETDTSEPLCGYCANPPGEGDTPASATQLRDKFDSLTQPMLGAAGAASLYRLFSELETLDDFGQALVGCLLEAENRNFV